MRILIVDDELPIREWLKMSIDHLKEPIDVVKAASNGKEAWDLFQEMKPDLVIADIRMPKMDGLELLKRMKTHHPQVYVVMLTSHSEFEYAREAFRNNANEYVLKTEVTEEALAQMLNNCKKSNNPSKEVKKMPYLKEFYQGKANKEHFPCAINSEETFFVVAFEDSMNQESTYEGHLNSFIKKIEHLYYEENISIWVCYYKNNYSSGANYGEAMSFCTQLATLKDTSIGFSGFVSDLHQACWNARLALNRDFYEDTQRVFVYQENHQESVDKIKNTRKKIISMINKERQVEAEDYIQDLIDEIEKGRILDLELIHSCFQDIVDGYKVAKLEFSNQEMEELCKKTKENMLAAKSIKTLKKEMNLFIQELKGTMMISPEGYSTYVKMAIAYVSNNYGKMDSASEVAGYININPDYFSRLFKSEVGITFNNYLTNYRVQKAIELLTKTDLKVYEVAEKVGYTNLSYFSRVFKKVTGVNPFFYKN